MNYSFTQPICASCYATRNPDREPVRIIDAQREGCVDCGEITYDGIYIRIDPQEAKHPTRVK